MLRVRHAKRFKKDVKRLGRSGYPLEKLERVISLLSKGENLSEQYKNHHLKGDWAMCEECHLAPDWLFIYERSESELMLVCIRTGTHAQLFNE